jgi:preprotein translocase subunit YajC
MKTNKRFKEGDEVLMSGLRCVVTKVKGRKVKVLCDQAFKETEWMSMNLFSKEPAIKRESYMDDYNFTESN